MSDGTEQDLQTAIEAVQQQPSDTERWDRVEALVDSVQRPTDVSQLFQNVLSTDLDAELASDIGQRAVRFYESWYGEDSNELPQTLERVLQIDPGSVWAFERLTVAYTVAERWGELLKAYDAAIAAANETSRRMRLLDEAAQAAKDFAGEADRAIDYMNQLFVLDPDNASLASSLERLLERQKRWADLIALWESRIEVQSLKQARETRLRMAKCFLDKLADPSAALTQTKLILEDAPDYAGAYKVLERILMDREVAAAERRSAQELLKAHFLKKNKPKDVVRIIEGGLDFAQAEERRAALRELVERLVDLGEDERAMHYQSALLVLEPMPSERDALRTLAERTRDHMSFAKALVEAADGCQQATTRDELLMEAARSHEHKLNDTDTAIALYQRVFGGDAEGAHLVDAGRSALRLLEHTERDVETVDVLARMSELESDTDVRRGLLGRLARLAEKLGDGARAQQAWSARVGDDVHDVEALDALVSAAAEQEQWQELSQLLRKRIQAPGAAERRREDLAWLASVHAERLSELDAAIDVWREAQQAFGEDRESVTALTDLLSRAQRWPELAEVLSQAAGHEVERFTELQTQLGDAYRERLDKPELAALRYRAALQVDPRNSRARDGLQALLELDVCRDVAVDSLAEAYSQTEEWDNTMSLVEPRLSSEQDFTAQAEILIEAAQVRESRCNDPASALAYYRRAFALIPDDRGTEREIRRLAEQLDDWQAVVDAYRETIASFERETPRVAELRNDEARTLELRLSEREAALGAYEQAANISPDRSDFASSAARLAAELGDWDRAATRCVAVCAASDAVVQVVVDSVLQVAEEAGAFGELCESLTRALPPEPTHIAPKVLRSLHALVATLHREKRGEDDAAEQAYLRAVQADATHAETLGALAELQRRNPSAALIETLLALSETDARNLDPLLEGAAVALELSEEPADRIGLLQRLYDTASGMFREQEEASGERDAQSAASWALEHLVGDLCSVGEHKRALANLVDAAALPFDPEACQGLRHQAAELAAQNLKEPLRAMELYRDILQLDPRDFTAIEALAKLYSDADRLPELLMLRRHQLALGPNPDERLALRLEIVRVLGEIESRGGRIQALEQNLEQQPGHRPTIEALSQLLRDKGQHAELAAVLSAQAKRLSREGRAPAASQLWREAAGLYEHDLQDRDAAIDAYRELHALDPAGDASEALARLFAAAGEHAEAAQWLELRLGTAPPDTRAVTAVELAKAHVEAGQLDRARGCLEQALAQDPSVAAARELLAELYRRADAWEPLAALLVGGAEQLEAADSKLLALKEAATLYYHRLNTPERAIPALESALALSPGDRALGVMLAEGLRMAGRYDDARANLEGLIAGFGRRRSAERAQLHYQLARVLAASDDPSAAMDELETATKMDLAHADALHMLAKLARDGGDLDRAERAYRGLLMLVRRLKADEITGAGPSEVFYELYGIALERGQEEQAEELLESALEAATQSDAEARRFQAALLERNKLDLLMRVLDARMTMVQDPRAEAEVIAARADVLETHLDQKPEALEQRLKALTLDPDTDALHAGALRLALSQNELQRYLDSLTSLADKAGRKRDKRNRRRTAELTLRLGEVIEQQLSDLDRAAGLYAKVEASGECVEEAWLAMARVAGARGDVAEQRRVLHRIGEAPTSAPTTRNNAYFLLAEMELADESTCAEGIESLSRALETEPDYGRAREVLERARKVFEDPSLMALWERVARASRDDSMLLSWFDWKSAQKGVQLDDVREGIDLSLRLGEVSRAEQMLSRAAESVREGDDRSAAAWVFSALAECRIQAGDIPAAIAHLQEAVSHAPEGQVDGLTRELAALAAEPGGDPEVAIQAYTSLLGSDPGDRSLFEPLLEVYFRLGERERLERFIEETLQALLTPEDRAFLHLRRARFLIEVAGAEQDAVPSLQALLEEEPTHIEATDLLTGIYQRNGMQAELSELLGQQFDRARDEQKGDAIAHLGLRLGELHSQQDKTEEALDVYRAALEWVPEHRELLHALLKLLGPSGEPRDRAEAMHALLKSEEGEPAAELGMQVADLWGDLLEDERAQEAMELGYRACPAHEALRSRLEAFYAERELWRPFADLMVDQAQKLEGGMVAVARLKNAANIYREQLSDTEAAAEALRRALEVVPDDLSLLGELARNLAAAGQHDTAIDDVTRLLDNHPEADAVRVDLLRVRADLHKACERFGETVADLEEAYAISPPEVAAALCEALNAHKGRAFSQGDGAAERSASLRLVEVFDAMGHADRAREALAEWVNNDPTDAESLRLLYERDVASERWDDVALTCQRLIEAEEGQARAEAALRLADACERAGRPEDAKEVLERVQQEVPEHRELAQRLRALYELVGASEQLATLLLADAQASDDGAEKLSCLQRAAELYLGIERPEQALAPLEEARSLAPDDKQTELLLIDLYTQLDRLDEAEALLAEAISAHKRKRSPELALLQVRMGRLQRRRGDAEEQLKWLNQALDTDRKSGEIAAEVAEVATTLQNYDVAMKALRTITMMEDPRPITRAMAFLKQAQIAVVRGDARRAQHWARKAKSLDENLIEADTFLAELG